jgi:hypothetical protein
MGLEYNTKDNRYHTIQEMDAFFFFLHFFFFFATKEMITPFICLLKNKKKRGPYRL